MKTQLSKAMRALLILVGISAVSAAMLHAQGQKISWSVIGSGGAINVASGQYRISATLGQPAVGNVNAGSFRHFIGFWGPKAIKEESTTGIDDNNPGVMGQSSLITNYPNPFSTQTTVSFVVPSSANVTIRIMDMVGREVRTLVNGEFREAGDHMVVWDSKDESGADVGAGTYICEMSLNSGTDNMKARIPMMLVK
jgi:hypothetical protein